MLWIGRLRRGLPILHNTRFRVIPACADIRRTTSSEMPSKIGRDLFGGEVLRIVEDALHHD
jgi:hypothetical protein